MAFDATTSLQNESLWSTSAMGRYYLTQERIKHSTNGLRHKFMSLAKVQTTVLAA